MIYLASRSPRRRELLAQIGVKFEPLLFREGPRQDADTDELVRPGEQCRPLTIAGLYRGDRLLHGDNY